ncbi:hypothetical protein QUC31_016188 [Theobroma cacao]
MLITVGLFHRTRKTAANAGRAERQNSIFKIPWRCQCCTPWSFSLLKIVVSFFIGHGRIRVQPILI